jgi:hypothetical protein
MRCGAQSRQCNSGLVPKGGNEDRTWQNCDKETLKGGALSRKRPKAKRGEAAFQVKQEKRGLSALENQENYALDRTRC